ncbi:MAG: DUF192 domain-containing protein [Candidatus Woesearchaeota archaeon]
MVNIKEKIIKKFKIKDIEVCDTFWKRLRGMMFSRARNLVIVLDGESRLNSMIHMFFVFYPIDVYWLDKDFNVVDKRINLKPFRMAIPKEKAKYVVELKR